MALDISEEEEFDARNNAYIAFMSSAIAGFKPQREKYKSASDYAVEVRTFAQAVAEEAMVAYLKQREDGFEDFDSAIEDEEEEEEGDDDEEDEDRPARKRGSRR